MENHSSAQSQDTQDSLLEKVTTSFRLANESLESLFVKYEIKTEILVPDKTTNRVDILPVNTHPVATFAFKRNKRFYMTKQSGEKSKTSPGYIVRYEKGTNKQIILPETFATSFDGMQVFKRYGNTFETLPLKVCKDDDITLFRQDYLESVMLVQPSVISNNKMDVLYRFPDALNEVSLLKNYDCNETIDGVPCCVLELKTPNRRVYIDPSLGYAVRRIDYIGKNKNEIVLRITNSDFSKMHNSIFCQGKS